MPSSPFPACSRLTWPAAPLSCSFWLWACTLHTDTPGEDILSVLYDVFDFVEVSAGGKQPARSALGLVHTRSWMGCLLSVICEVALCALGWLL